MKLAIACLAGLSLLACGAQPTEDTASSSSESSPLFGQRCFSPSDVPQCPVNSQPEICPGPAVAPPGCVPTVPPIPLGSRAIWCCRL